MADSLRETIMKAIKTAHDQAGPVLGVARPAGLTIHRFRDRPISVDSLPAGVIFPDDTETGERVSYAVTQKATRTMRVVVQHRALAAGGMSADEKLDPQLQWTVAVMSEDWTLGGLATNIEEVGTRWDSKEDENGVLCAANISFDVMYDTKLRNMEAP